jgi:hypothetical protein
LETRTYGLESKFGYINSLSAICPILYNTTNVIKLKSTEDQLDVVVAELHHPSCETIQKWLS